MTRLVVPLMVALGLLTGADAHAQPEPEPTIRVLTYNIHRGIGTDGRTDLERIAAVIRDAQPDVVALQEVDRGTTRSGGVDQAQRLAELTGMHPTFGKAIDYQGGAYGQLILTRAEPLTSEVHRLPGEADREQRIAVEVTLEQDGVPWRFIGAHLDHRADSPDRLNQARAVAAIADEGIPAVLVGDLNDLPGSETLAAFDGGWTNASGEDASHATFPAGEPQRQIDYVLVSPPDRWRVVEARVIDEPVASDHRPLLAVVELLSDGLRQDGEAANP